ncbi:MAG: hypothetical protein J0L78_06100 [Planctomycetes bacterium]|nr:hypothetical protein [Planctomycetota bacterium]
MSEVPDQSRPRFQFDQDNWQLIPLLAELVRLGLKRKELLPEQLGMLARFLDAIYMFPWAPSGCDIQFYATKQIGKNFGQFLVHLQDHRLVCQTNECIDAPQGGDWDFRDGFWVELDSRCDEDPCIIDDDWFVCFANYLKDPLAEVCVEGSVADSDDWSGRDLKSAEAAWWEAFE